MYRLWQDTLFKPKAKNAEDAIFWHLNDYKPTWMENKSNFSFNNF